MEWFVFWLIINIIIGYAIGKRKDAIGSTIAWSVLLGPIGWLIAALLPGAVRKCPFCAELVKADALVCRHCGRDLPREKAAGHGPESLSQKYQVRK